MAVFVALMVFIGLALAGLHFYTRLRHLEVMMQTVSPLPDAGRYKPMLRLLSADDEQMLAGNPAVLRDFRKQRIAIFRMYLRSLTKDYGTLLAGIRTAMAYSADDRPELATALSKNRVHFTMAVCRIEYGLFLYWSWFRRRQRFGGGNRRASEAGIDPDPRHFGYRLIVPRAPGHNFLRNTGQQTSRVSRVSLHHAQFFPNPIRIYSPAGDRDTICPGTWNVDVH
jgi:hypothetical protein